MSCGNASCQNYSPTATTFCGHCWWLVNKAQAQKPLICREPGCTDMILRSNTTGLCGYHWWRQHKQPGSTVRPGTLCSIPGCSQPALISTSKPFYCKWHTIPEKLKKKNFLWLGRPFEPNDFLLLTAVGLALVYIYLLLIWVTLS